MGNASSTQLGSKSTAEDVAAAFPGAVRGKTALVTGGYSGLGLETARVLALNGATVVIAGRSQQAGDEAVQKLKALAPAADVSFLKVDLADIKQTTAAAAAYAKSGKPLHLLLNNAGVMACPKGLTKDGIETQMGTNHIGHFALTRELLPLLKASAPSRVVNLSSMGQWIYAPECGVDFDDWAAAKAYNPWDRYGQAKLANLLHAKELQRRLDGEGAKGVTAVAVHPGVIMETGLTRHFGLGMVAQMMAYPRTMWASAVGGTKTTAQGAGAIMYAAVAPVEGTPAAAGAAGTVVPGGYYAECALETSWVHPRANDTELAAKLWRVSDETVDTALRA